MATLRDLNVFRGNAVEAPNQDHNDSQQHRCFLNAFKTHNRLSIRILRPETCQ